MWISEFYRYEEVEHKFIRISMLDDSTEISTEDDLVDALMVTGDTIDQLVQVG